MKKIKYQGGITKILAEKKATYHKNYFLKNIENIFEHLQPNKMVDYDVISFSGAGSFADQLLSVYSFVLNAGVPQSWTLYSDKSYTEYHVNIFQKYFPFLTVKDWDIFDFIHRDDCLKEYLKTCHLAKKVNILLGHVCKRQTIYTDSDVVFYSLFKNYLNAELKKGLWYSPDAMKKKRQTPLKIGKEGYNLNSGFLVLNNTFNGNDVLSYFENLNGNYEYFSEQSSIDFAFKKQDANILNPALFVVSTDDQFDFSYKYFPEDIALRHYVSPVRHKIWQKGWQWHFAQ